MLARTVGLVALSEHYYIEDLENADVWGIDEKDMSGKGLCTDKMSSLLHAYNFAFAHD